MGVLYRAVWGSQEVGDLAEHMAGLGRAIAGWALGSSDPSPLEDGETEVVVSQGRRRTIEHRSAGPEAFAVTVRDQSGEGGTEWTVRIRVVLDGTQVHVAVENEMDSDDVALQVSVGRPRVVRDLLLMSARPMLGASTLLTEPLAIPAAGVGILTEILSDPGRTLPVIVCSQPPGEGDGEWLVVAKRIASRVEGVANVLTLDDEAVTAFRRELGSVAIWGGGVRVYLPGAPVTEANAWRHRYYVRARLEGPSRQSTIDRIVYTVAQISTRRRIPAVFRPLGEQGGLPADALDGVLPVAEFEALREQSEYETMLLQDELGGLEKELARANGHLARLKDELIARGMSELIWGTQHDDGRAVPDEVQDTSDAVLAAQMYLADWLVLPASAPRDLGGIDTGPNAYAWGNTTWRGLRALAAYAQDQASGWNRGGFWEWCASGPLLGWPATPKKLSMTESETVRNSRKWARARIFPVDRAVDPSGEIQMLAHLKISEGGGDLAPRVYFHDDTGGATGKVHVGLVGPHSLVENKSTN